MALGRGSSWTRISDTSVADAGYGRTGPGNGRVDVTTLPMSKNQVKARFSIHRIFFLMFCERS